MKSKIKQQGFSLLEVLVALFLIGAMLILYQSAINTIGLSRNAKDQQIALRIASHKMEQLRASGYDNLPANGSFTDSQLSSIPAATASMSFIDYTTKTKQATVTVTWREPGTATNHSVVLDTLITKVGGLK